jgi:hypothetical protein
MWAKHTLHRYNVEDRFWRFQSSGSHRSIWLIGAAGRFVSSCVR